MSEKKVKVIKAEDKAQYAPGGHAATMNRLILCPEEGCPELELIIGEMGPKGMSDSHSHDYAQLSYLIEGKMLTVSGDEEYIQEAGDTVYIPAGVDHKGECLAPNSKFILIYCPPRPRD